MGYSVFDLEDSILKILSSFVFFFGQKIKKLLMPLSPKVTIFFTHSYIMLRFIYMSKNFTLT